MEELCELNDQPLQTWWELVQVAGAVNALWRAVLVMAIFLQELYWLISKD